MVSATDLQVRDISVKNVSSFAGNGAVVQQTVVTFYVGTHGPFTIQGAKDQMTGQYINQQIDHQVAELRRVLDRP